MCAHFAEAKGFDWMSALVAYAGWQVNENRRISK